MNLNAPEFLELDINDVELLENNPRKISKAEIEKLCEDIQKDTNFLMQRPPLINHINGKYICYAGNQRVKAAMKLGWEKLWCWVEENVHTDIQAERMLKDNLHRGEWDFSMLSGFDSSFLSDVGFQASDLDSIFAKLINPKQDDFDLTEALDAIEDPITQIGDLIILGDHRLICGDARDSEIIEKLMAGELADMCTTDAPYNVDYEGGTKKKMKIQNDKLDDSEFYNLLLNSFTNACTNMKEGAMVYIFHADTEGVNFRNAMVNAGFNYTQSCVWVKNSPVMGRQDYHWKHEPVLVGWKPGAKHAWYGGRTQNTVWEFNKPSRNEDHPTMKPVELICYQIQNSSKVGDIIIDLFGGSGTTLISCEQMQRKARLCELDPIFCDVIIKRWEKLTNKKALRHGRQ